MKEKKTIQEEINQVLGAKKEASQRNQDKKGGKGRFPVLRTLKQDADDYIKRKNVSMVDIAAERARAGRSGLTEEKPMLLGWIGFSVAVVACAVFIVGGFFSWRYYKGRTQAGGEEVLLIKPILVAEEEFRVNAFQKEKLLSGIEEALAVTIQPGRLLSIPVLVGETGNKKEVGVREFFNLLNIAPPLNLRDSLNEKFMLAKFYLTKDSPVLILKIDSYNHAFAGMMNWERSIFDDLKELLSLRGENSEAFKDKEVQGVDARVLKNKEGSTALIYAFSGRDYLVITVDEEPFLEIFRRFTSSQYLNE